MPHIHISLRLLEAKPAFPLMLRWFEHNQVYHPLRQLDTSGADLDPGFEDIFFQTSDGLRLNGWFFPARTNSSRAALVMLICHGNAGNISHRLGMCDALLSTGVNVFVFDYRGYGRSQGRPSEEGTYLDAQAAYNWLRQKGFAAENIIVHGESLGGGVGSELALRERVGGLVLLSTFTSIPDIGAELFPWLPVRLLTKIKYETHAKLARIHAPLLVMHSRVDRLVSFRHSEKNFAEANEPKLFWELRGGHNEMLIDCEHFVAGIEKFLRMVQSARGVTNAPAPSGRASEKYQRG